MDSSSDSIERTILLRAPRSRVWRALSDAEEFGSWFGVTVKTGRIAAGEHMSGQVTHPEYQHMILHFDFEQLEQDRLLSWRWHPAAVDPSVDYSKEPQTEVVFMLDDVEHGTLLTIIESGFDRVPAARRLEAFRMHNGGWDEQMRNIQAHVSKC